MNRNGYFSVRAQRWYRDGKDPRWVHVKVAKIFSRLSFAIVAGGHLFPHPCCQQRHYILGKLLEFHADHRTDPAQTRSDLETVIAQLPARTRAEEVPPLRQQLDDLANRRRGPQPLASILSIVLARLQAGVVQSIPHEGPDL